MRKLYPHFFTTAIKSHIFKLFAGAFIFLSAMAPGKMFAQVTSITLNSLSSSSVCEGGNLDVNISSAATGTNTYTVQLSDNTGSFATAADIGTADITDNANNNIITVTIPLGTPAGSGYLIQVVSSAATSNPSISITVDPLPIAAGTITGTATVCQGQSGVAYSVPAITNATGYTWTLPAGATIATGSNTNNITVDYSTTATSGDITVFGTNACGNGTVSANFAVTVNPLPVAAGTITGTATVCQGQSGVAYSVPAITNATGYTWTLPAGATIATGSNTNNITVDYSTTATSGDITVFGTNACGNGTVSANFAVTVNPLPVAAGTITGTATVCQGQSGVAYSVPAITNATGYTWTLPAGATIATGSNTNNITVDYSTTATSGDITVFGTNACGNGTVSANFAVTVNPLPVAAGTITGTATVCQGQSGVAYSVPAITNATGYTWTLPAGATIATGSNTNNITVDYSTTATSGDITVFGTNACGNGTVSANFAVTVNPLPVAAGTITGTATVCQGQNSVAYSVPAITNATGYTWAYSGTGATISGSTRNITINFSATATAGNLTVMGTNACGNGTVSANFAVTVNPLPVAAGTITGTATVCQGQSGVAYSVPAITNATGYTWTLPTGATIATGTNTNSITVNYSTTATSGNITVLGTNACGNGTVSANFAVTVNPLPVAAGTITGTATVCQGQSGVAYSVPAITNATGYTWTLPAGATIATGTNTNSITVNYSTTATSGNITVRGTNACGNGTVSANFAVTVNPLPVAAGTITGTATVCQGQNSVAYSVPSITNAASYTWAYSGTGATISGSTRNITINFSATATAGNLTVMGTNACGNGTVSANFAVTVNPLPVAAGTITGTATVCQGQSGVAYSVPAITNATGYTWTLPAGATIATGTNTNSITVNYSTTATSGNITVLGTNACGNGTVSANFAVTVNPLPVAAGTITGTATVCQGQSGVAYSVPAITNATGYTWTLPTGATIATGTNTRSITVNYSTTATSGNITVLGTNACGNGTVSANFAVTVNPLPVAAGTITGTATVCQGQSGVAYSVPAITNATGYTWTLPTGATIATGTNTNSITVNYSTTATSGNITVLGTNACGNGTVSANFAVTVNPLPVAAGTITGTATVCQGQSGVAYSVPAITNATGYTWTLPAGATIATGTNTNSITVNYSTTATSGNITVRGTNACGNGTVSANFAVTVNPLPVAAGTITGTATVCQGQNSVAYSVPSITNAASYTWAYSGTGATISGSTRNITINFSATATAGNLTVMGTNACGNGTVSANFAVTVNPLPVAAGTITGTATVCQGQSGVAYSVPAITNATGYTWTLPAGATIATGTNTNSITVNYSTTATSGNITVLGTNACGNGTVSANFAVTVNPLPVAAGTITGTATVCQGQSGVAYSVPAITNATGYTWTLPAGATIATGTNTNSITVNYSTTATSGNITVRGTNACGNGTVSANFAVTVNPLPVAAGTITGTATVCQGQNSVAYSVPSITNAASYTWAYSGTGATISGSTRNITINFSATATAGNLTVMGTNACGNGTVSANFAVTVNPLPVAAGTITGTATVCQGQSGVAYSVPAITNATGYTWTLPAGATIATGTNTNSITVNYSTTATSGNITVRGTNACGNGTVSANFAVTVNPLPVAAGTITGTANVCQGQNSVAYSVPTITNATGYTWSLPAGATIATGTNTKSITVNYSTTATSGNITVFGTNACGNGTVSANFAVTVNPNATISLSSAAGTDNQTFCLNTTLTNITYAISGGGTGAGVTGLPAGVTGSYSAGVFTISGTPTVPGIFNYTVTTTGICAQTSATGIITINPLPQGTFSANGPFCTSGTGQLTWTATAGTGPFTIIYNDGTADQTVNNVNSGTPFDVATNPVIATTTYTLESATDNIGCVSSGFISLSATITVNTPPSISADPTDSIVCATFPASFSVAASGTGLTYQWYKDGNPLSDNSNITGSTADTLHIAQAQPADQGDYSVLVGGAAPCTSALSNTATLSVSVNINITSQPVASQTLCEGSTFTVSVAATGTINIYDWYKNGSGTPYAPAVYDPIAGTYSLTIPSITAADAGSYQLRLDDATGVGCSIANSNPAVLIVNAASVGGTVSSDQTICSGTQPASLTLSGNTGNVIKWQSSTDAAFTSPTDINVTSNPLTGAQAGVISSNTYFRAVVQNGICGTANSASVLISVDPVSVGGTVSADQTVCSGTAPLTDLTLSGNTGNVIKWQKSTTSGFTAGVTDIANTTTTLTAAAIGSLATTTYFRAVVQSGVCSSANSASVTITVSQSPTVASTGAPITGNCTSSVTLNGNNPTIGTGLWTIISGAGGTIANPTSRNSIFTTASTSTVTYTLRWTISNPPCAATFSDVDITFNPAITNDTIAFSAVCRDPATGVVTPIIGPKPPAITGGNGTFTYVWERSCLHGNSGPWDTIPGQTGSSLVLQPNTNCFYRRIVTSGSCTHESNHVHVNVNNNPTSFFNITPTTGTASYCAGGPGVIVGTDGSILGSADYTTSYQLYLNGNIPIGAPMAGTGGPLIFGPQATAGTYTVTETISLTSGGNGCGASTFPSSITISIDAPISPSPDAGPAQTACGTVTMAANTPVIGTALWSLVSGGGTITTPTSPITTVTALNSGANVFKWKFTNGACADSSNVTITASQPNVAASSLIATAPAICNGGSSVLTQSGGSLGTGAKWQWYSDASFTTKVGGLLATANAQLTVSPSVTTTYYLQAEGATAPCTSNTQSPGSVTVTINPRPTSVIGPSQNLCNGSTASINVTLTGTGPWNLTYFDGTTSVPVTGIATSPYTIMVSPVSNKTYTITALSDAICTSVAGDRTGSATITILPRPTGALSVSGATTICKGNSATLSLAVTGAGTISGTLVDGTPFTGVAPTITVSVSPLVTTTYSIATLTNGTCSSIAADLSGTPTVTVNNPVVITTQPSSTSFCLGNNASIAVVATGASGYQWQVSTTGGGGPWSNLSNVGPYSGVTFATLNVAAPTLAMSTNFYRVVILGSAGCSFANSNPAPLKYHDVWMGTISTDWTDVNNWSDGSLPSTICPTVYIPNRTFQPTLGSSIATITNLIISASATVTVNGTGILQIGGAITNSGTFDVTAGTLEFNGTSQSISGSIFKNRSVKDLIVTSSGTGLSVSNTAGDTLNVLESLSFGNTTADLNTGGNVTLKSTISSTAGVGVLAAGNVITGNVTVERYIPTGIVHDKSWQLLAIPTDGSQNIKDAWQEGATATNVSSPAPGSAGNLVAGYGTMLTSNVANATIQPSPGFDFLTTPGPSIKNYVYSIDNYVGPSSTQNAIYDKRGYFLLVRGDRSVYTSTMAANPTTLRTKGTLFTPAHSPNTTTVVAGHFESVGNPYASQVDLTKISKPGVDDFFYLWDPQLGGSFSLGAFVTLAKDPGSGLYLATPPSPTYPGPVNYIQSGQAFLVFSTSGGTVSFDETAKANGSILVNSPALAPQFQQQLRTNLFEVKAGGNSLILDGVLNSFADSYNNAVDGFDARKSNNTAENLSINVGGKLLSVERRQTITKQDTIFLNLTNEKAQTYRFHFDAENLDPLVQGFLVDNYANSRTPLNMTGSTEVNFTVTNIAASYAANRFMIVFAPQKALPVTFTSVKAYQQDKHINIEWRVNNEVNMKQYEVEKSINGTGFTVIATKPPTANNGGSAIYVAIDASPVEGYNYYRIKSMDINGKTSYTNVVKVLMGSMKQDITINPNPITDGMIHLQLMNMPQGKYNIRLLNKLGQLIVQKQITHAGGNATELIQWNYNLAHGMYQVEVIKPDGSIKDLNVMY